VLEGVVSNVANFGAFVDIGVHQDGLVHISSLTEKFVSDPREVVKAGDIVKVKVLEVDAQRKRINLTMKMSEQPPVQGSDNSSGSNASSDSSSNSSNNSSSSRGDGKHSNRPQGKHQNNDKSKGKPKAKQPAQNAAMGNAFADAFAKMKK
jgi:uncharacterized protein